MAQTATKEYPQVKQMVAIVRDITAPPDLREDARSALRAMGRVGGLTTAELRQEEKRKEVAASAEAYRKASRG